MISALVPTLALSLVAMPAADSSRLASDSQLLWVQDDGTVLGGGAGSARGDDDERDRRHFVAVEGLRDIVAVALAPDSGPGAAALDRDGRVWLWGRTWCPRVQAEAACESTAHRPGVDPELREIAAVSLGDDFLIALGRNGRVRTLAPGRCRSPDW